MAAPAAASAWPARPACAAGPTGPGIVLATAAALLAGGVHAAPARYALDPTHSFVTFEVLHFDTSTIRGRLGPLNGEVQLDREGRRGRVQVVVDTAAASTGLAVLDARLKAADMFDVAGHPQAFFVAEAFAFSADGAVASVRGEFTLRGVSQPLELKAQRFRCYTNPLFKREVCGGDFDGELQRSRFGITFGQPVVADTVRLRIQVEAIRQD